jgi:osmoprotectant transport system permease protein
VSGYLDYWRANQSTIISWLIAHAWLSALPVLIGLVVSLPLGWLATRHRWLYAPLVTTSSLIYTIPSIALFVLLPGIIGTKVLDPANVVVALSLYTVALLVRVVADGLRSVPEDVAQAATAMGFRRWQRFFSVELPVAVPVIAAGLRVAAVSNVSLVAIASTIGVDELGQLFTSGFQTYDYRPIVIGIVLCVLLAVVFDAVIVVATRMATPWRRAVKAS